MKEDYQLVQLGLVYGMVNSTPVLPLYQYSGLVVAALLGVEIRGCDVCSRGFPVKHKDRASSHTNPSFENEIQPSYRSLSRLHCVCLHAGTKLEPDSHYFSLSVAVDFAILSYRQTPPGLGRQGLLDCSFYSFR